MYQNRGNQEAKRNHKTAEGGKAGTLFLLYPGTFLTERYKIQAVLGHGGFGAIYKAWDRKLEICVAIKEYFQSGVADRIPGEQRVFVFPDKKRAEFQKGLERFMEEARNTVKFSNHDNIVNVYDYFEENGTAYIVMEYLKGETLGERLAKQGRMSVHEAKEIIIPILQALGEVHKAGILHRDVTPENIFLTAEGRIKLLDFGAARFVDASNIKKPPVILRTGYSPIEQYTSKGQQGPWTDVYGAAATLYKMITGITPNDALQRAAKDTLKSPSSLGIRINKDTERALQHALSINVEKRTQTAENFSEELYKGGVRPDRKILRTIVIGAFILVLSGGILLWQFFTKKETAVSKNHSLFLLACHGIEQAVRADTAADEEEPAPTLKCDAKVMPDIREFVLEDAMELLDTMEISFKVIEEENPVAAPGTVISQSIAPKERIEQERVVLIAAKDLQQKPGEETVQVEDLTGRLYEEVKRELREKGVYLAKYAWEYHADLPMGSIVSQRITGGNTISPGEVIAVAVNVGYTQTTVPDVTGRKTDEAVNILKKSGFTVTLTYENSAEVPADSIIGQDAAGEKKAVSTNINLHVSLGKKKEVIEWTTDSSLVNNSKYSCETKTEYRCRTRTKSTETTVSASPSMAGWNLTGSTQVTGDWGAWSGWSESAVSGSDTRQVESRETIKSGEAYDYVVTEYRYRDRTVQTNYNYTREVYTDWSEWSVWQQESVTADDCTNVETRTLYRYTEKERF